MSFGRRSSSHGSNSHGAPSDKAVSQASSVTLARNWPLSASTSERNWRKLLFPHRTAGVERHHQIDLAAAQRRKNDITFAARRAHVAVIVARHLRQVARQQHAPWQLGLQEMIHQTRQRTAHLACRHRLLRGGGHALLPLAAEFVALFGAQRRRLRSAVLALTFLLFLLPPATIGVVIFLLAATAAAILLWLLVAFAILAALGLFAVVEVLIHGLVGIVVA